MSKNKLEKCQTCGKKAHNFRNEEALECVPPANVLNFGEHNIDINYRTALYNEFPMYTSEEVVGSFLGHNPYFPNQYDWIEEEQKKESNSK